MKPNIEKLGNDEDIFFNNIIDYYQSRPDSLENISLAIFAADYEYYKKNTHHKGEDDNLKEDDNIDEDDNMEDKCIVLKDNMGYLKRRKKSAIIRYFINKREDEEQQIKSIMLLFHPFRNEVEEVHNFANIKHKYNENKLQVYLESDIFKPNPDFIDILDNINIQEEEEEEEEGEFVEEETTTAAELRDFITTK